MRSEPWARNTIGRKAHFSFYNKTKKKNKEKITASEYGAILDEFHGAIRDMIIEDGFQWSLPQNFGMLFIVGRINYINPEEAKEKKNRVNVDWPSTLKYWEDNPEAKKKKELIPFDNFHTNGYIYKVWWRRIYSTRRVRILNLKVADTFKTKVAKQIKKGRYNQYQRF